MQRCQLQRAIYFTFEAKLGEIEVTKVTVVHEAAHKCDSQADVSTRATSSFDPG